MTPCRPVLTPTTVAAGEEADDDAAHRDDAVDDGREDTTDAGDDGHDGGANGPEDGRDLVEGVSLNGAETLRGNKRGGTRTQDTTAPMMTVLFLTLLYYGFVLRGYIVLVCRAIVERRESLQSADARHFIYEKEPNLTHLSQSLQ